MLWHTWQMPVIPEGFVTLEEAASAGNCGTRTIRYWAEQRKVHKRKIGGRAYYNKADVEAQLTEQATAVIVANPAGPPLVAQLAGAFRTALEAEKRTLPVAEREVPLSDLALKRYLTFKEAARLDGRSEAFLRYLARRGDFLVERQGPRGCDLIAREDLEKL